MSVVKLGHHREPIESDERHTLIIPNVNIRCEHIRGTNPNDLRPIQVPTSLFLPSRPDISQAQLANLWSSTSRAKHIIAASARTGIQVGLTWGTFLAAATFTGGSLVPVALTWSRLAFLTAKFGLEGFCSGALVGMTIGSFTQWRLGKMEKERAALLDAFSAHQLRVLSEEENPEVLIMQLVRLIAEKKAFENKYGEAESAPLTLAFIELKMPIDEEREPQHV